MTTRETAFTVLSTTATVTGSMMTRVSALSSLLSGGSPCNEETKMHSCCKNLKSFPNCWESTKSLFSTYSKVYTNSTEEASFQDKGIFPLKRGKTTG